MQKILLAILLTTLTLLSGCFEDKKNTNTANEQAQQAKTAQQEHEEATRATIIYAEQKPRSITITPPSSKK